MTTHFVIIGNGAAGYRAAKALRGADADAQVSIFSDERHPFYLRRQLGDFLSGAMTLQEIVFQSRNAYRRERIDLFLMTPITSVDPDAHVVQFAASPPVRYDRLLLATGTEAVLPAIPGRDLAGVTTFDTLAEAADLRDSLKAVERAVILEEGVIGLTLAESLLAAGVHVTQLMAGERFWPEAIDETTSARLEALLEERGVVLRRQAAARAVIGTAGRCAAVELADGQRLSADLVACGCQRRPATRLAEAAGIEVGAGIRVDETLHTSRPDVFAAGDVTEPADIDPADPAGGAFCWQRAWAQGATAAASMLDQHPKAVAEAVRIRTSLLGLDLAILGQGHLPAGGSVTVHEQQDGPEVWRRLVYRDDHLVGAIILGTGESVHELGRLVVERATPPQAEAVLAPPEAAEGEDLVPTTFARHCPICAAELVVHRGTREGAVLRCHACNTDLVVCWNGRHGWFEIRRP